MCDHYSDDILSLTKSNKEFASKCLKRRKEGGRGVNAFLENVKKCRMGSGYCGASVMIMIMIVFFTTCHGMSK